MSDNLGRFPSFNEIQELREKYKRDPEFINEINRLIYLCLQYNAEGIRKNAHVGLTDYDFKEPHDLHRCLMDLRFSKPDFYRLLETRVRKLGYKTLLSVYHEYDEHLFCDLMISW